MIKKIIIEYFINKCSNLERYAYNEGIKFSNSVLVFFYFRDASTISYTIANSNGAYTFNAQSRRIKYDVRRINISDPTCIQILENALSETLKVLC